LKATASNQVSNATCRVDCYQLEAVRLHRFHPFRPLNFSTVQVGQPLEIQADPAVPCAVYNWSIVLDGVVQYFASTDEYHNRVVYNFSRAGTYTVTVSAVIGPFSVSDAGPVFALPAQQFCREPEQFVLYPKSQTLIDGQKIPVGFHDQLSSSLVFHPIINTEIETCGFHGNQSVSYTLLLRHLGTNFTRLIGPSVWPTMHLLPSNQPLGEYYAVAKATIVVVGNQQLQRQKIYAEQSFRALLQPSETWLIRLLPEAGVAAYRWVSRRAIDGVEATAQPLVFAIAVNPDR
uniref:PKD domain-containing protein n=2 Tax=Macrostomum lignano TaxID=282301 RepID=A0A1I8HIH4_9PLAT